MSYSDLAKTKETVLSGGHQNYYLVFIAATALRGEVTVEVEDIIEDLEMLFSAGCVFKALVRLCKLRMDLGKPGSTKIYESEKTLYYSQRTEAISKRHLSRIGQAGKMLNHLDRWRLRNLKISKDDLVIHIRDPKRLQPYSFKVCDFIAALNPTRHEAEALEGIIAVSYLRTKSWFPSTYEVQLADKVRRAAVSINLAETRSAAAAL